MATRIPTYSEFMNKKKTVKFDDRYDFSQKVGLTESANMVIMGVDSDTDKCGFSTYDPCVDEVLRQDEVELSLAPEYFADIASEFDMSNFMVRLEVPTMETVWGVCEKKKAAMRAAKVSATQIEKAVWLTIAQSFRCNEVANQLIQVMKRRKILYELVNSGDRVNMSNKKYAKLTEKQWFAMLRLAFVSSDQRMLRPTKLKANLLKSIFNVDVAGSDELKDSLTLTLREAVYHKIIRKI